MVYNPKKAREISIKGKQITDAVNAGMRIAKEDLNKPLTPKQLKELQKKQPSTSPYKDYRDYTGKGKGLASLQMHPNLDGIGVHVPTPDDTGASDDYYGTPSDNPNMPRGWQMKIAGSPSFDINESSKNRKIRGIRKLQEGGKGGEAGAAGEMLKKFGGPQLPINLAHNYRQGPTGGSMYNELMIRARDLMNSPNPEYKQRGLDILKISPEVYKLEQV